MKCLLCKDGNTAPGKTVVTLSRKEFKFVFRNVPAMICHDCSEVYITEEISGLLLNIANESFKKGEASYTKDFIKS